jgi:hypothetical protein
MLQFGGKNSKKTSSDTKRHFTVVMGSKEHGLYVSSTPSSAAKKAITKLCTSNKSKKVQFHIREITQGSKKKIYGPYIGYIEKLKEPIELKGRIIKYKPVAKLSRKKNKQKGGYHLSDMNPGFMLNECIKRIGSNVNYFKFDQNGYKLPGYGFDETYDFLLNDTNYNGIFKYLINTYNNDERYEQLFQKSNGEIIAKFEGMIPYHINIGALMFLSFIIELEIFTLFSSIIPFNTSSKPNRNNLPTAFQCGVDAGICTRTRIFRNEVSADIITIFRNFTGRLDNIFNDYMSKFVNNLTGIISDNRSEILKCIVPVDDWRYEEGKFNFIFVDWKDRILRITKLNANTTKNIINNKLQETMLQIQNQHLMHYIAEATGFFSYMYLIDPKDPQLLYGSCITYSMFELYIMSRLHIPGDKLILLIEKQILKPHEFWKITQKRTSIPTLTHYATKFNFSSLIIEFRSQFIQNGIVELPFSINKDKILKLFIYIIFDMNIRYFLPKLGDDNVQKILVFIKRRINLIESLLGSNDIINALNNDDKIRNYLIELSTSDNSVLNNIDLDKVFEKPNIKEIIDSLEKDKLIFNAISRNNLELVENLINLDLPFYSTIRYQGKSILEAILSIRVSNIYSKLFIKIITNLKRLGFVYEIVNVLQNIRVNNIDLYNEIKKILGIPNLTYDTLLLDRVSTYSGEYITNEILINPNLIQEINERRNDKGQSLLYIYCSFRLLDGLLSYILRVNEILDEYVIDVNIQNNESLSTPLHGLLWHGINGISNKLVIKVRFYQTIKLLKRNNLNINIKNKFGLTPIQELDTKDIPKQVKDEIIKELS